MRSASLEIRSPADTCKLVSISLIAVLVSGFAHGQEQPIELYKAPLATDLTQPTYPGFALRNGKEGWVRLNFMVDPQGQPYEVHIADHAGDEDFIDAARAALERSAFTPARLGDETVEASSTMLYRFIIEDAAEGARRRFASHYRRFMRTLEEKTRHEAAVELARLEDADVHNNYEYAYLSMARYYFAARYGTRLEQMNLLANALGESPGQPEYESFLPHDTATSARRALFQLQAQNGYLKEALDTWQLMEAKNDDEGLDSFRDAYEQLVDFRASDESYAVAGQLDDNGSWYISLFKDSFQLGDASGTVEELKLRCERDYVFFEFEPEMRYDLSGSGECSLEVIGDPGVSFVLVQQ